MRLQHEGGGFLLGAEEEVSLFPGYPELESRYSEESFIRMAYLALEDGIERSGALTSFKLEDFRTHYRRDFERVLIRDLMTLDLPFRLDVRQTEVTGVDGAVVGIAFTPRWVERFSVEELDEVKAFMDHYREVTIAESLRHPEANEDHRKMIAVTSYQVTVEFEGRTLTYRAAFKWMPGAVGEATFVAEDHVTDGVDRALIAAGEIAPVKVLLGRGLREASGQKGGGSR
jgi:hypothetical protein